MPQTPQNHPPAPEEHSLPRSRPRFISSNAVRLSLSQWGIALLLVGLALVFLPRLWRVIEVFDIGADYRIPYELSRDYWLYTTRLERLEDQGSIAVLGDSVVWGEYVRASGTLSHFLGQMSGSPGRFVNIGVNGLFPLALEGLVRDYARPLRNRKVLLHCNLLWMSSPEADLSSSKEQKFNHARLVPQFLPKIPCYRASVEERLGVLAERILPCLSWVGHLRHAYLNHHDLYGWTLADDGTYPPRYPNAYRLPLAQWPPVVPGEPEVDPDRGPGSPRHRPWSTRGVGTQRFEWVDLNTSRQWASFKRLIQLLRRRGNPLFIVLGPFNEHIMAPENRALYRERKATVEDYFARQDLEYVVPEPLPSALYADASHPLTEGYELLAKRLLAYPAFRLWLNSLDSRNGGLQGTE